MLPGYTQVELASFAYSDSYRDANPQTNLDQHRHRNRHAYADSDSHAHADSDSHRTDTDGDPYRHPPDPQDADVHTHGDAYSSSVYFAPVDLPCLPQRR
jgi:hypothetical protein